MSAIEENSNQQRYYYYGPNGEVRRGDTGRVVSDLKDPSARPAQIDTGGSAKPLILLSMGRISRPEELDPVADILHALIQEGKSDAISDVFSGMADPKVFAICVAWSDNYPDDETAIKKVLSNVFRGDGRALGSLIDLPRKPVEGMYEAFSVIQEAYERPTSEMLANRDIHGVVNMFNDLSTSQVADGRYAGKDGRQLKGCLINRDMDNAYRYFIKQPDTNAMPDEYGGLDESNSEIEKSRAILREEIISSNIKDKISAGELDPPPQGYEYDPEAYHANAVQERIRQIEEDPSASSIVKEAAIKIVEIPVEIFDHRFR